MPAIAVGLSSSPLARRCCADEKGGSSERLRCWRLGKPNIWSRFGLRTGPRLVDWVRPSQVGFASAQTQPGAASHSVPRRTNHTKHATRRRRHQPAMSSGNRLEHAPANPSAPAGAGGVGSQVNEKRKPPFRPAPDDTKPVLRDPVCPLPWPSDFKLFRS